MMQLVHENGRKYWDIWRIGASILIVYGALYRKKDIRKLFFHYENEEKAQKNLEIRKDNKIYQGYKEA
jgi:hypothetical protein